MPLARRVPQPFYIPKLTAAHQECGGVNACAYPYLIPMYTVNVLTLNPYLQKYAK